MNDDFLKKFRKPPRQNFSEALLHRLQDEERSSAGGVVQSPNGQRPIHMIDTTLEEQPEMHYTIPRARAHTRSTQQWLTFAAALLVVLFVGWMVQGNGSLPPAIYETQLAAATEAEPEHPRQELSEQEINKAVIEQVVADLWNGGDLNSDVDLYASPYQLYLPTNQFGDMPWEVTPGTEDNLWSSLRMIFPDGELTITGLYAEADRVTLHYAYSGTFAGLTALEGVWPPEGFNAPERLRDPSEQSWTGINLYRLADGHITEEWWYWDDSLIDEFFSEAPWQMGLPSALFDYLNTRSVEQPASFNDLLDYYHQFVRFYGMGADGGDEVISVAALEGQINTLVEAEAMPTWTVQDVYLSDSGDLVAHVTLTSEMQGPLPEDSATLFVTPDVESGMVSWDVYYVFEMMDGKIVSQRMFWDGSFEEVADE